MVSIAEFLIGHGSHGTVLLRYLRDLTLSKNEFLRKHKVCLNHSLSRHSQVQFYVYCHVTVNCFNLLIFDNFFFFYRSKHP